jgi:DNA-binding PucR family transcriptional regulator
MATISSEPVKITIPAAYLEDARKALAREIASDAESFGHDDVLEQASNAEILQRSLRLHQQVVNASTAVTVTAERDHISSPIEHMLDEIVRIVAGRLDEAKVYGPVPMGTIRDIADELRWVATEAIRVEPSLDQREEA